MDAKNETDVFFSLKDRDINLKSIYAGPFMYCIYMCVYLAYDDNHKGSIYTVLKHKNEFSTSTRLLVVLVNKELTVIMFHTYVKCLHVVVSFGPSLNCAA